MAQAQSLVTDTMQEHLQKTVEMLREIDLGALTKLVDRLADAWETGRRVFIFGNGGSAAAASHFAEDLAKGILKDMNVQRRLRVMSLADSVPFITALGNDCGYESVFREQLLTLAERGDLALAISGSGNSPNILAAVKWAKDNGLFTCGFTGFNGGKLRGLVDLSVHSPVLDMEVAENCHMVEIHMIVAALRAKLCVGADTARPLP
jgi:D-sedoheptulose 7-phosphate isomerase